MDLRSRSYDEVPRNSMRYESSTPQVTSDIHAQEALEVPPSERAPYKDLDGTLHFTPQKMGQLSVGDIMVSLSGTKRLIVGMSEAGGFYRCKFLTFKHGICTDENKLMPGYKLGAVDEVVRVKGAGKQVIHGKGSADLETIVIDNVKALTQLFMAADEDGESPQGEKSVSKFEEALVSGNYFKDARGTFIDVDYYVDECSGRSCGLSADSSQHARSITVKFFFPADDSAHIRGLELLADNRLNAKALRDFKLALTLALKIMDR